MWNADTAFLLSGAELMNIIYDRFCYDIMEHIIFNRWNVGFANTLIRAGIMLF